MAIPTLTIDRFLPTENYPTGLVARLFGKTQVCIVNWLKNGKLRGEQIVGTGHWLVYGDSIHELYRSRPHHWWLEGRVRLADQTADRPSIHEFQSGTLYSVAVVASLFGRSPAWVHEMIRAGKLEAPRVPGTKLRSISGESVRVLWGELKLAEDIRTKPRKTKTVKKASGDALKALDRL